MSDAALRVRAFLMTLSEEDRAWLADELAASLGEPQRRGASNPGRSHRIGRVRRQSPRRLAPRLA